MKTRASECRSTIAEQRSRCGSPEERAFFEAAAFIASSTPETARFLAAKEGAFYYYAHRQVVPIYAVLGGDVKDILAYLAENEAEYVFLSHLKVDEWVIVRPLEDICSDLDLVHSWGPTTLLLRVDKGAGSKAACEAIHAYAQAPWGIVSSGRWIRARRGGGVVSSCLFGGGAQNIGQLGPSPGYSISSQLCGTGSEFLTTRSMPR
mgnify:CR=1 FL=1